MNAFLAENNANLQEWCITLDLKIFPAKFFTILLNYPKIFVRYDMCIKFSDWINNQSQKFRDHEEFFANSRIFNSRHSIFYFMNQVFNLLR